MKAKPSIGSAIVEDEDSLDREIQALKNTVCRHLGLFDNGKEAEEVEF